MSAAAPPPVDEPRDFLPRELFFSLTDEQGRIRCGNAVFTRISGYEERQLVGQPHNIIRHPDMPRCVFQLLWDYLLSGRTVVAYVKNIAADGRYYWVLAVVTPCADGFLSVRLKPSTPLFEAARSIYAEVLQFERRIEANSGRKDAIAQSMPFLIEKLTEAGFDDYDTFMRSALSEELKSRAALLGDPVDGDSAVGGEGAACLHELRSRSESVVQRLASVFESLDTFNELSERLADRHRTLEELGPALTFLALNSNLAASRLGADGATLSVLSRELADRSKEADVLLRDLVDRMAALRDNARRVAFDVAVAQIEAQVCEAFSDEILADPTADTGCIEIGLEPLNQELRTRCRAALDHMRDLVADVDRLKDAASRLVNQVSRMHVVQVNGKIEIAGIRGAENFASIFDDVSSLVKNACDDCSLVIDLLADTRDRVEVMTRIEPALNTDLSSVACAVEGVLALRS